MSRDNLYYPDHDVGDVLEELDSFPKDARELGRHILEATEHESPLLAIVKARQLKRAIELSEQI